jgi:hypothetical protein
MRVPAPEAVWQLTLVPDVQDVVLQVVKPMRADGVRDVGEKFKPLIVSWTVEDTALLLTVALTAGASKDSSDNAVPTDVATVSITAGEPYSCAFVKHETRLEVDHEVVVHRSVLTLPI